MVSKECASAGSKETRTVWMSHTVTAQVLYILVRESGTELVVRVMLEVPEHDTCQKYVDEVVSVICEKGYKA